MIEKIKLKNFKNFRNETIKLLEGKNIFVGENGVGKSSILQAIALVLSGSYSWLENIGIDSLMNKESINEFYETNKDITNLPILEIELYLKNYDDPKAYDVDGSHNSDKNTVLGLKLTIEPNTADYSKEIKDVLKSCERVFPFEFYKPEFLTFSGKHYNSYQKVHKIKYSFVDTSTINYATTTKKYVQHIFDNQVTVQKEVIVQEYRKLTNLFNDKMNSDYLNKKDSPYELRIKTTNQKGFLNTIDAHKQNVSIEDLGMGEKVMIGVDTTIKASPDDVRLILIEEPENHLSHLNVLKLIDIIEQGNQKKQLFIATHSNTIAARLGLKNAILINYSGDNTSLSDLSEETSKFFIKSPTNNILNFILAKKVILVEGDAEYILMDKFFEKIIGYSPHYKDITIISCGGRTFKRYIEVAKKLNKKIVIITDNDKNYQKNVCENYQEYCDDDKITIVSDKDNNNDTFEVCLYNLNKDYYEKQFKTKYMRNGVLNYLLSNKAEAAFRLLETYPESYIIPKYIEEAIRWIVEENVLSKP